jgi:hypothetical protein
MNKILVVILVVAGIIGSVIYSCGRRDKTSNERAENDKNGRYLTVINETKQVINEIRVTVNNGTEIESMRQKDVDKKSLSIPIPKTFKEYDTFNVILVDRYGTEYKKTVKKVKDKGRTEVVITKDDVVKETDSFKKKIDRFFNGD